MQIREAMKSHVCDIRDQTVPGGWARKKEREKKP